MTVPWSIRSVASELETKYPQIFFSFYTLRFTKLLQKLSIGDKLHLSFAVVDSDGMAIYSGPHPVSNLSQIFRFPVPERKKKPGKTWPDVNGCGLAGVDFLDLFSVSIDAKYILSEPKSDSKDTFVPLLNNGHFIPVVRPDPCKRDILCQNYTGRRFDSILQT